MNEHFQDAMVRARAFAWLEEQVRSTGDEVLSRATLEREFQIEGVRVPLVGPPGIWKPRVLTEMPLSITTVYNGPYNDSFDNGLILYRYRGQDPGHRDNVGLRLAMARKVPLIYFHGILKGQYLAVWPAYIVHDDPSHLTFRVAVDDHQYAQLQPSEMGMEVAERTEARREYITATVRQRLHQRSFRERVLQAYQDRCALCRLKHHELLDAAHIIPDSEPEGSPLVTNGIALCKLHHAAFDRHFIGIRPDYIVEVRMDLLREKDGPMLLHGLQGMHHRPIELPRSLKLHPDRNLLERRYQRFREVG
ncbi:MAG: HNH endonuclease [Verrucomicrobiota bacterium]|jgi:putative restriction endonuclease